MLHVNDQIEHPQHGTHPSNPDPTTRNWPSFRSFMNGLIYNLHPFQENAHAQPALHPTTTQSLESMILHGILLFTTTRIHRRRARDTPTPVGHQGQLTSGA